MIEFRSFRNTDPPHLASIWRGGSGRAWAQPMSAELFERYVLSRPYFDRHGLIVATEGGTPVGFAHAGFGPTEDHRGLSRELGVTCQVMVRPGGNAEESLSSQLLERAEEYLREQGARILYGGCIQPLNPFYFGLYGGSELPGILDSDVASRELYLRSGYKEVDRTIVFQRELRDFHLPVDRRQMQVRRSTRVDTTIDPPFLNWWEACTMGLFPRTRHGVYRRSDGRPIAVATWRGMEPLSTGWGVSAAGLTQLEVDEEFRRQGYGTFLLGEIFRQLQSQGVTLVEAQTMQRNKPAIAFYLNLGFRQVDSGAIYRKER